MKRERRTGAGLGCGVALCLVVALLCPTVTRGLDQTGGEVLAVPVRAGAKVVIDGSLDEWDRSAEEWFAFSDVVADRFSGKMNVMYDEDALYFGGEILTGGGALLNENTVDERPWMGHDVEFRFTTDPELPYPLTLVADGNDPKSYPGKVKTVTVWQDTRTQTPNMWIVDAPPYGKAEGRQNLKNPEGASVVFKEYQNPERYIVECRLSWKTLGVPGGKNPFKPGQGTAAHWTVLWPQGVTQRATFPETAPTGSFGWQWYHAKDWGRLVFSDRNDLKPRHGTMAEYLAKMAEGKGTAFEIDLPAEKKVSVSIFDKEGHLLRELIGGELRPEGKSTVYWDGYDWFGNPMPAGEYTWKAYGSDGLSLKFMGAGGTSAKVPWETKDGKGNWGAIGIAPQDIAADATGHYFLWQGTEGGSVLVKTDLNGEILWRTTPITPYNGTYGPFLACAANGKYVFVVVGRMNNQLIRLEAETGMYAPYESGEGYTILNHDRPEYKDESGYPQAPDLLVAENEVYVPYLYDDKIGVYSTETGEKLREIEVKAPVSMALDSRGTLFILSTPPKGRFTHLSMLHKGRDKVAQDRRFHLRNRRPWGLAIDAQDRLYIAECGETHQVWVYNRSLQHIGWIGRRGGRAFGGAYDSRYLRDPHGICVDGQNRLLVAEASWPNVFQMYQIGATPQVEGNDLKTGDRGYPMAEVKLLQEWFGDVGYSPATWPSARDPLLVYSYGHSGVVRAKLRGDGTSGGVEAYWVLDKLDFPEEFSANLSGYRTPTCFVGDNGVEYMVGNPMSAGGRACLLKVEGDVLTPLGYVKSAREGDLGGSIAFKPGLEVWSDLNHDRKVQDEEIVRVNALAGESLAETSRWGLGPVHVAPNGDLYLADNRNKAYRIPVKRMDKVGVVIWDWDKSVLLCQEIIPMTESVYYSPRQGIFGIDPDNEGNLYFNLTDARFKYANKAWTEAMALGLGHTGGKNLVKWTKFDKDGKRVWIAGRKAQGVARPGEVYHHWGQGGLLGKGYLVGASEWNTQAVYSPDGFFVDSLFTDPNQGEDPGPTTIGGGETFAGKAVWFPERGEAYAYTGNTHGMAYRIDGFEKDGTVKGEIRLSGTMTLEKTVNPYPPKEEEEAPPTTMASLANPMESGKWGEPAAKFNDNNGAPLATLYLGYDDANVYARFVVRDNTPLENHADLLPQLFKHGDAVGLYFGQAGERPKGVWEGVPQLGDVRFLATEVNGKPVLQAMVPVSDIHRKSFRYTSPVGDETFAYVGPVEGGQIKIARKPNAYTVDLALPKAFFEGLSFTPGSTLAFEAEVLLSGNGQRGFQAISRNHLYTSPTCNAAKMVDDIPSEARLYPLKWGQLHVSE